MLSSYLAQDTYGEKAFGSSEGIVQGLHCSYESLVSQE